MASRSTLKRLGAAILGASLVLMSALPAAAADKVKVEPDKTADQPGMGVYLERDGKPVEMPRHTTGNPINAELIGLKIVEGAQGQTARAYCVELPTPLYDGKKLEEVPWDKHPNPNTKFKENAGLVNWVLQNSYPHLTEEQAEELYGLGDLRRSTIIAATQAAVWHFSDGVDLRKGDSTAEDEDTPNGSIDELVYKVYEYLTTKAVDIKDVKPDLGIEPALLKGDIGTTFGPFTITTTAEEVELITSLPAGVTLVNEAGEAFKTVKAGEVSASAATKAAKVWVKVDKGVQVGELDLVIKAGAKLRSGRLFVSENPKQETQSLVIATSEPVNVEVKAKAEWVEGTVVTTTTEATPTTTTTTETTTTTTDAPVTSTTVPAGGGGEDDLANTGASIFVPLLIGIGLLGAGAGALLFLRRKRAA
ncbi:thioester domain-containing protein [Saccharothrix hoggarensis]|uniref:Thioester domain-containing protein n=1 Tax=Saccharothrix hoggarensis TaxID=913853 RepID=A0ABW3QXF3_9PSEU